MEIVKQDYYSIGTVEDIVISSSSLSHIDPTQGGNPAKFLDFFIEDVEKKNSIAMDRGSLLHLWHEDSKKSEDEKQFIVADIEKPSDMMVAWCERICSMIASSGVSSDTLADEVIHATREDAYKNIKDPKKLIQKFEDDGRSYYNFLQLASGKIALSTETRRILEGQISSILGNKKASAVLFGQMPEKAERLIELEVYWEKTVEGFDKKIKFKAKLDNVVIRWDKKTVYINDLKTTSKPVSLFKRSFINFRYYRQLAFYSTAIIEYLISKGVNDLEEWSIVPRVVAIDNTKFFSVSTFGIDVTWQRKGTEEHMALTNRVIWHIASGNWETTPEEFGNKGELYIDYTKEDELFNSLNIE